MHAIKLLNFSRKRLLFYRLRNDSFPILLPRVCRLKSFTFLIILLSHPPITFNFWSLSEDQAL